MDERKLIATAIKDYLARERMSREQFAFKTKLGKSTIDKLLIGLFSDKTLAIVENHTRLELRSALAAPGRDPDADPRAEPVDAVPSLAATDLGALDKPSIAVLPFDNMSGDLRYDYVSDGITEEITTALARLRWLFVIARNSSFTFKGKAVDVRQVARELGVRYVLEGSVKVAAARIRVTTQLIDAETGKHIWAARYDRELENIFAVQDDIPARNCKKHAANCQRN
jgi:TolB-like protein